MSGFREYERYDGLGFAELVRRREVTPRELLEAALARIERVDPKIRAVCGLAVWRRPCTHSSITAPVTLKGR